MVTDGRTHCQTRTAGLVGDMIRKGYASLASDPGHTEMSGIDAPGNVRRDRVDDFLWRSQEVLTQMGKAFTRSFDLKIGESGRRAGVLK